jgi:streptogramin lyase
MMKKIFLFFLFLASCGKHPADSLRVGQSPLYNFPLFVTSANGTLYKFEKDGSSEAFVTGLNDPRGLAIDKYQNIYVAEYGNSQVIKIDYNTKAVTAIATGLQEPTSVAVDSFGDVYVTQEGPSARNVMRVKDAKIINTYSASPSAVAFGVNDIMLVGLFNNSKVYWGGTESSPNDTIQEPVMITTDANGRVYVAEGTATNAKIYRYHQSEPSGKTVVADGLQGASGIAVDPVGNVYISEPGASRISLATIDGQFYFWSSVPQPQQLAFTPY